MRENIRHPFAQLDDTGNLTKHWPCAVKTHFPGQHIRPGRNIIYEHWGLWSYVCISPGKKKQSFVSSSRFLDQTIGGFRTRNYGFKIRFCHAVFKTPDYEVLYYTSDILGIITIHHGKSYEPTITPIFETEFAAEDGNRWSKIKRKPGAAAASYLDGPASPLKGFSKGKVPQ